MKVSKTPIADLLVIQPAVFGDSRGFFSESFNRKQFAAAIGVDTEFVQDNQSRSSKGVLRGLHYQIEHAQGKLVRVTQGAVYDVAVDIRRSSPTFGQSFGLELSEENKTQLWIPPGFAHGFLVLSDSADFLYKTTDYYYPQHERCIRWNDPELSIVWPVEGTPSLSAKDDAGALLKDADLFV